MVKRHLPKREDPVLGVKHEETTYIWERRSVEGRKMIFSVLFMGQVIFRFHLSCFFGKATKKNNWRATNCWHPLQPYQRCFVGTSCVKLAGIFSLLNRSLSTIVHPEGNEVAWVHNSFCHACTKKSENHSASLSHSKVYGAPPIYWFIMAPTF